MPRRAGISGDYTTTQENRCNRAPNREDWPFRNLDLTPVTSVRFLHPHILAPAFLHHLLWMWCGRIRQPSSHSTWPRVSKEFQFSVLIWMAGLVTCILGGFWDKAL